MSGGFEHWVVMATPDGRHRPVHYEDRGVASCRGDRQVDPRLLTHAAARALADELNAAAEVLSS